MSHTPGLERLLSDYLHEDWELFNADWQSAVDAFVDHQPSLARQVPAEVEGALEQCVSEDELEDRLDELGCGYYPAGGRWRDWLISLKERVQRRIVELS